MRHLMLRPGRVGPFRRCVRDGDGKPKRALVFEAGKPQEVKPRDLPVVAADIGKALVEVRLDDKGRPRPIAEETPAADPGVAAEAPPVESESSAA